jgi:hypothetical protein
MTSRFPHLSRLVTKLLELAGAGAASAAGAFLFSQLAQPAAPQQILPPVQVVPASTELVQVMRKENALLVDQILKEDGRRREAEANAPRAAQTPAPKPIKAATVRRESKPDRSTVLEGKARLEELQTPASRPLVNIAAQPEARPAPSTSANLETPAPAPQPRAFGWLRPAADATSGDVPRPPMPVGEVQLRAM